MLSFSLLNLSNLSRSKNKVSRQKSRTFDNDLSSDRKPSPTSKSRPQSMGRDDTDGNPGRQDLGAICECAPHTGRPASLLPCVCPSSQHSEASSPY